MYEEIDAHNQTMSAYIQQFLGYPSSTLSTVVEVKMPGLAKDMLLDQQKHLAVLQAVKEELEKFGKIKSIIIPSQLDVE